MRVYTFGEDEFSKALRRAYAKAAVPPTMMSGFGLGGGFGAPPGGIREFVDEAQARAIVAALRQGVTLARASINYLSPTTLSEAFLSTPLGWLVRWASPEYAEQLLSDHKKSSLKNVADTVPLIDKLDGVWFDAAKTGVPSPDGLATWSKWKENAGLVADALRAYVQYQRDASLAFNAPRLIADLTISIVNCITNPERCMEGPGIPKLPIPWWVTWAGVGAALVGGAYIYNSFFRR